MTPGRAPAWVGIGAQRSGTTWFTDLVLQHPDVALPRDGKKEAHFFDRFLASPWSDARISAYHASFPAVRAPGEFTPAYLRCLWVPRLLARAVPADTLLVVLLRDPVERFRSSLRWMATRPGAPAEADGRAWLHWVRDKGDDALWGGMYATQLDAWLGAFPRTSFLVMQYERIVADPAGAASAFFARLGLPPRAVTAPGAETWNATGGAKVPEPWNDVPGLAETLRSLYAPEADRVCREWGLDRALWRSV
ncbi:MAG: hypothetical protein HMLKMBBP_01178 [Planctomycetes bacterium]|nr:hypothetical protein [Planctomycetota bacterium]